MDWAGHFLLGLGKRNETLPLPWTRLGVGSPVILSEERRTCLQRRDRLEGNRQRIRRDAIQVAVNQFIETDSERPTFRLDRATDEISRFRQRQAMELARGASGGSRLEVLRDVLIGSVGAVFEKIEPIHVFNQNLNRFADRSGAIRIERGGCGHHPRAAWNGQDHHAGGADPADHAQGTERAGGGGEQPGSG
jgi:hypothetical protein